MKIEEAIRILHPDTSADEITEIKYKYGFRGEEQVVHKIEKACKIACKAMEKQIPQKVIYGYDEQDEIKCSVCGAIIGRMDEYYHGYDKYCFNCLVKVRFER